MYRCQNISFKYDKHHPVINFPDLCFEKGKIYALFGPNGSGKTTLLKILNGLLQFQNGKIIINNEAVITSNDYRKLRKYSVYVHSQPLLLRGSVNHNIKYGLKLKKYSSKFIKDVSTKLLELLDLNKLISRNGKNLSTGEIKRIAIARAIATAPQVLLLDEPSANIDQQSLIKISETLQEINHHHGTTIIFSSHDQAFTSATASQVLQMKN